MEQSRSDTFLSEEDVLSYPFFPLIHQISQVRKTHLAVPSMVLNSDDDVRHYVLNKMRIADLTPSHGHRYIESPLRNDSAIQTDVIMLNALTQRVEDMLFIERVEIWDGHHRLHDYYESTPTRSTLAQYTAAQNAAGVSVRIVVLIDSKEENGSIAEHWVDLAGIFFLPQIYQDSGGHEPYRLIGGPDARRYSACLDPHIYQRLPVVDHTLKDIQYFPVLADSPKLGLYFGTFDPVHKGHLSLIEYLLRANIVDILVVIPNANRSGLKIHADIGHRTAMLKLGLTPLLADSNLRGRLYLFEGNNEIVGSISNRDVFCKAISQIFGVNQEKIFHIEGWEEGKNVPHPRCIFAPRGASQLSLPPIPASSNHQFLYDYYDRWNVSATLVREWLQTHYITNPHVHNPEASTLLNCVLPEPVFQYIRRETLYSNTRGEICLPAKTNHRDTPYSPKQHHSNRRSPLLSGYFLTTGAPDRIALFQRQVVSAPFYWEEIAGFDGRNLRVYEDGNQRFIVYDEEFLGYDYSDLKIRENDSRYRVTVDTDFSTPLSNFELAVYLSHLRIWTQFYQSGCRFTIVCEDRVVFHDGFAALLYSLVNRMERDDVDFCYLYSAAETGGHEICPVGDTELLLTSYILSRPGAKKLMQWSLPIRKPVDWFVKQVVCTHPNFASLRCRLVDRNKDVVTTNPKARHTF